MVCSKAGISGFILPNQVYSDLLAFVAKELSPARFKHSLRVAQTAGIYAARLGYSATAAWIAGIGHDLAREWPAQTQLDFVLGHGKMVSQDFRDSPILLHGLAAAIILREHFGIVQFDIIEAVENHTLGAPGMRPLAKILFAADYLEPGRKFTTVQFRRSLHRQSLDCLVSRVIEHSAIRYPEIHPLTMALYAETVHQCSGREVEQ